MSSLPSLTGKWRIERRISNGSRAQGVAVITAAGGYTESVTTLLANGQSIDGVRSYSIVQTVNQLELYFADGPDTGKLFQRFNTDKPAVTSTHHCKADTYVSTLSWRGDGTFTLAHQVRGPAKEYTIETVYTRL